MRNLAAYFSKASATEDDGVIGYQAQTVAPPYTQPSAVAALPSRKTRWPTRSARFTRRPKGCTERWSRANSRPACSARTLESSSRSLPRYCSANSFSITSAAMPISWLSAPSTMMFLNSVRSRGTS